MTGQGWAVEVKHLQVVRGATTVLDDLSVRVASASVTGLVGPSGCGKTTLIRCIVGNQVVNAGEAQFLGLPAGSAAYALALAM